MGNSISPARLKEVKEQVLQLASLQKEFREEMQKLFAKLGEEDSTFSIQKFAMVLETDPHNLAAFLSGHRAIWASRDLMNYTRALSRPDLAQKIKELASRLAIKQRSLAIETPEIINFAFDFKIRYAALTHYRQKCFLKKLSKQNKKIILGINAFRRSSLIALRQATTTQKIMNILADQHGPELPPTIKPARGSVMKRSFDQAKLKRAKALQRRYIGPYHQTDLAKICGVGRKAFVISEKSTDKILDKIIQGLSRLEAKGKAKIKPERLNLALTFADEPAPTLSVTPRDLVEQHSGVTSALGVTNVLTAEAFQSIQLELGEATDAFTEAYNHCLKKIAALFRGMLNFGAQLPNQQREKIRAAIGPDLDEVLLALHLNGSIFSERAAKMNDEERSAWTTETKLVKPKKGKKE